MFNAETSNTNLMQELAEKEAEMEKLHALLQKTTEDINTLQDQLIEEREMLTTEISRAFSENEVYQEKVEGLNAELSKMQKELQDFAKMNDELRSHDADLREQMFDTYREILEQEGYAWQDDDESGRPPPCSGITAAFVVISKLHAQVIFYMQENRNCVRENGRMCTEVKDMFSGDKELYQEIQRLWRKCHQNQLHAVDIKNLSFDGVDRENLSFDGDVDAFQKNVDAWPRDAEFRISAPYPRSSAPYPGGLELGRSALHQNFCQRPGPAGQFHGHGTKELPPMRAPTRRPLRAKSAADTIKELFCGVHWR